MQQKLDTRIPIGGMTCAACATRLEKALAQASGVDTATVNFALERADLSFDPGRTDIASIAEVIKQAGFEAQQERFSLPIEGMTCGTCAGRVEKTLRNVPGVVEANVNLALERADVWGIARGVTFEQLAHAVEQAGYRTHIVAGMEEQGQAEDEHRRREQAALRRDLFLLLASIALAAPLMFQMVAMAVGRSFHLPPVVELVLATPVQFIIGARFYRGAYRALRAKSGNMDVLVVMGTTAAYAYSVYLMVSLGASAAGGLYFEAAVVIITLVLLGKFLEARAKRGTTAAIRQLMDLRPEVARIRRADGSHEEVPINQVRSGDLVIVKPGERVPVDGEVVAGQSEVDESLLTGESMPVEKGTGHAVTGGAINGTGLLEIRATAVGEDATLAKIIRLVENAQAGKAPVQRLVDRISEIFVPTVVTIALLTFAGWFITTGSFENALISAVSVLVIACPCALGLATPTAIMTGTGAAARAGILIRDVESLERAHRLSTIIFDKTGTLTQGSPTVVNTHALRGSKNDLIALAAAVQQASEHPLAKALLDQAMVLRLDLLPVTQFKSHTGRGVSGVVDGREITIGNEGWLEERDIDPSAQRDRARQWEAAGKTVIWIADEETIHGIIAIADTLRVESVEAVQALKDAGIQTILLSGDAVLVAEEIGRQAGIDSARGLVKPDEKAQFVEDLVKQGHIVGMVGDGINDAPALAAADVGIAMGTGTDIAMESAGITLMRADPRLVAAAIAASRVTFRKIKQNLFWAFVYNAIGIPLAAAGYLSPAMAGAAMAMSSVSVVCNSLLLRRWKPEFTSQ